MCTRWPARTTSCACHLGILAPQACPGGDGGDDDASMMHGAPCGQRLTSTTPASLMDFASCVSRSCCRFHASSMCMRRSMLMAATLTCRLEECQHVGCWPAGWRAATWRAPRWGGDGNCGNGLELKRSCIIVCTRATEQTVLLRNLRTGTHLQRSKGASENNLMLEQRDLCARFLQGTRWGASLCRCAVLATRFLLTPFRALMALLWPLPQYAFTKCQYHHNNFLPCSVDHILFASRGQVPGAVCGPASVPGWRIAGRV